MIIKYKRNKKGMPQGLIVVLRDENNDIGIGWALCSKKDSFDKTRGRNIAIDRAIKGSGEVMPFSIEQLVDEQFQVRCNKYFREEVKFF